MRQLLFVPFLCAGLAAQSSAPNRFIPKNSALVARMAAPAKMKQQFQTTQIAKLLQAATMAPLMAQAEQMAQGMLEQLRSSGQFDADLLEKLWSDYRGDIALAVQFDASGLAAAVENGDEVPFSMVVSLSPAEGYDLGALATAIGKFVEDNAEGRRPLKDLQVGDHLLRVTADELEPNVSIPTIVDGHLVMLVGTNLETDALRLLGTDDRAELAAGDDSLFVDAKVGNALAGLFDVITAQLDAQGAPFDVGQILGEVGLTSLDTIAMRMAADGKHLAMTYDVSLNDKPSGLFGSFMVEQGEPKLLRMLPPSANQFYAGALDVNALYDSIGKVWTHLEPMLPMSFADFEALAAEELKVRLKEDLLAHVGTEILSLTDLKAAMDAAVGSVDEDMDEMSAMMNEFAGKCFVVALRDGKAFGESLEKALRARGMHAARKTEDYQGAKVHKLTLAGLVETEYCVTDDAFLLVLGKDEASRQNLRAVLDQRASGSSGALPENFAKLVDAMPKGWSGIDAASMSNILGTLSSTMEPLFAMATMEDPDADLGGVQMLFSVLGGIGNDLRQLGIEDMVATFYTSKRHLRAVMRW